MTILTREQIIAFRDDAEFLDEPAIRDLADTALAAEARCAALTAGLRAFMACSSHGEGWAEWDPDDLIAAHAQARALLAPSRDTDPFRDGKCPTHNREACYCPIRAADDR